EQFYLRSKWKASSHREYASRTLKDAETRYHSNELECTAVHWALTEVSSLSTWS
ncbi:hypothetical protein TNCV_2631381, partial [Trichonephila clavipes]